MVKSLFFTSFICLFSTSNVNSSFTPFSASAVSTHVYTLNTTSVNHNLVLNNNDDLSKGFSIYMSTCYTEGYNNRIGVLDKTIDNYYTTDNYKNKISYMVCSRNFGYILNSEAEYPHFYSSDYNNSIYRGDKDLYYLNISYFGDTVYSYNYEHHTNYLQFVNIDTNLNGMYIFSYNFLGYDSNFELIYDVSNDYTFVVNGGSVINNVSNGFMFEALEPLYEDIIYPSFNNNALVFYRFSLKYIPNDYITSSFSDIFNNQFDNGYAIGYKNGYNAGILDNGTFNFNNLFGAIANTPVLYLKALFNFEFFGIRIYQVVLGLVTSLLVLWLVKRVI